MQQLLRPEVPSGDAIVLYDQRLRPDLIATAEVAEFESHPAASPMPAVDSPIEERELSHPDFHLQSHAKRSGVAGLQQCFLTSNQSFVSGVAMCSATGGFH